MHTRIWIRLWIQIETMEWVCVTNASFCIVHIKFIIEPIKDPVGAAAKEPDERGGRGMQPGSWATRLESLSIQSRQSSFCFWPMSSGVCSSLWQTVCLAHTCLKPGGEGRSEGRRRGKEWVERVCVRVCGRFLSIGNATRRLEIRHWRSRCSTLANRLCKCVQQEAWQSPQNKHRYMYMMCVYIADQQRGWVNPQLGVNCWGLLQVWQVKLKANLKDFLGRFQW